MPFGGAIGRYLASRAGKKAPSRVSVEGVKKKVGEEASRLEGPKGLKGGAVKMLGGTTSTPGRQESAKRLRTWNAGGLGAMKGMQSTRGHLPQSSKPGAKLEKSQHAYDVGYAVGMLKSGSVERVEKQNAKLFKIAQLLQRKGKLQKSAVYWTPEGLLGRVHWGENPNAIPKPSASVVTMPAEIAAKQRAAQKQIAGQQRQTLKKPKEAPDGKIDDKNVISLDMDPVKRRRIQQRGVEGARRGLGGDGADGGMSGEEAGFYGGPKFGDIRRYYMQLLGMTPSQLSARDMAQEVGRGRAWRSRGDRNWLREMLG